MKKSHFISLIFCIMAGLAFSIGLCMCLLPEWNAFVPGVVLTAIGGIALLVYGIISYAFFIICGKKQIEELICMRYNKIKKKSRGDEKTGGKVHEENRCSASGHPDDDQRGVRHGGSDRGHR